MASIEASEDESGPLPRRLLFPSSGQAYSQVDPFVPRIPPLEPNYNPPLSYIDPFRPANARPTHEVVPTAKVIFERPSIRPLSENSLARESRAPELNRDQRQECRTLRKYLHMDYAAIAKATGYTLRQVQWACTSPPTPRKKASYWRRLKITTPLRQRLKDFLDSEVSPGEIKPRDIPWADLRFFVPGFESCGYLAICSAMRELGYKRKIKRRRIYRSTRNKRERVLLCRWALTRWPNPEDWLEGPILFSDETWATNDPQWKQWVTIHDFEDPDAFALLRRHPKGWMFWGSFAGGVKGPAFIWEKGYGGITAEKYIQHILPLVDEFVYQNPATIFQHDNASAHRAKLTKQWLAEKGIDVIKWPANSPDINPIENVWNWMKEWIESHYDIQSLTLEELRAAIWAAWEAIPSDFLKRLMMDMPRRLQQVIDRDGESCDR